MNKKRTVNRVLSLILSLVLLVTGSAFSTAAWAGEFPDNYPDDLREIYDIPADLSGKTVILHSNDVHGAIGQYAYIASVKENLKKRGAEVILADAGDFSQGTPYVSVSKGKNAVIAMNTTGYDVATLGNHEFDYGYPQLVSNLCAANFKVLCADILDPEGKPITDPSCMFTTKAGLKIGFFGMSTPETLTKVNPALVKGLKFLSGKELYSCAQAQVDALKADGADLVICLSHLGVDYETEIGGNRSVDLVDHTNGIDFLIDGHSHAMMTDGNVKNPVQSTGTKVPTIGVIMIDNATKSIEDHFLISMQGLQKEVITKAITDKLIQEVNKEYNVVFAQSKVALNGDKDPGNRTEETNLGNLVTDATVYSVTKESGALKVDADHVVAIQNGGGLRAWVKPGSVTMNTIKTVLPFGNSISVVYVTGAELLEALEASTFSLPEALGGYPQTAGIRFTVDTRKPFAKGALYPDSTYYKPASINRVTIESVNGKPFSMTDTYAVITNDFCADGGDTYYVFSNAADRFDTGIILDEAVVDYVKKELNGVIDDRYAAPRGDVTIIK
ncbi:MAG: 5'-nucleotidase C-terminal domain-containing protein [Lachnospiraceae bacterium]|nr:5'-nucleotidase C-terminal domain-containing protein [Lachnospiraceae bacterium]